MDCNKAAAYWQEKEKEDTALERSVLLEKAEQFIRAHNTCALATGSGDFVRCTPIEYTYKDGNFWMFSEGGLKFKALEHNKNVCLAIFESYTGPGVLAGMQVSGKAETVEPWSAPYRELLAYKKIPEEALKKLTHPMYLLRVHPTRIDVLDTSFKQLGGSVRQHIEFAAEP